MKNFSLTHKVNSGNSENLTIVGADGQQQTLTNIIATLKGTATDLGDTGWDLATGAGLLNLGLAVKSASDRDFINELQQEATNATIGTVGLQKGEEILSIANLKQLTAKVQIQQEDLSLVKRDQPVSFKLQDGGAGKYRANVNKISPIIQSDTPGAAPMATIEILIDNEDNRLLLEGKGYAHIQTNKMRIYQKIGHELGKLFDFGKFLPWL